MFSINFWKISKLHIRRVPSLERLAMRNFGYT